MSLYATCICGVPEGQEGAHRTDCAFYGVIPMSGPVCRGSWALGTACRRCERCLATKPLTCIDSSPSTSGEALSQLQAMGQDFDAKQNETLHRAHIASLDSLTMPTSGEEMRLREALEAITFLTCVSGDGPTPYLKVHFNDLAAAHAGHDALLAVKRGKS